jgi:hypothetical protein
MPLVERRLSRLLGGPFPSLLLLSVLGFALSLLLGRGTYKPSLYLCGFATAGMLAFRSDGLRLDRSVPMILGLGAFLLGQGLLMAGSKLTGGFHTALAWAMLMVFAVQLLPSRLPEGFRPHSYATVAQVFLVATVLIQVAAYPFKLNEAGLFSNVHYLALFSVVTLPVAFYFVATAKAPRRWLFALALLGDFWLLLKSQSRPGYLSLLAGAVATVPFLAPRPRRFALAAIVLLPMCIYLTGWFGFAGRVDDLAAHFLKDERFVIWRESWGMQTRSSSLEWWLGHGFGSFYLDYQPVSSFHGTDEFSFPHNYFLEVLYSHGILGVAVVASAFVVFFRKLVVAVAACRDPSRHALGMLLVSVAAADWVQGFLTLPLFSRHNLYPFSLILGASLHYLRESSPHDRA